MLGTSTGKTRSDAVALVPRILSRKLTCLSRESTAAAGIKMHKDLIFKYIELQVWMAQDPWAETICHAMKRFLVT